MADVNRGNRPLSPHLSIYRPQWTSIMSIAHRITGCALSLGAILVVWWLLAAASGPDYFATADGFLTSWIGNLIMFGSLFALCFHACNGVRHLIWDLGLMLDPEQSEVAGKMTLVIAGLLTVLIWIL
ncbi:MAG: succinate dehydrogenase, cytochrome b556 subunit [Rhodobacteraceae bacterium]|nr:succinate dehydrogenase, cytochrome b556 subunit [Paracoccaceae bacterium]MBR25918.1 succinate dehydrogenase, cytochrome b556 subunit [Paracoccaceae bacterium]|tara:strand:- start:327 stop:707 length:381 start_codon:yes stop_codon:yes gene_type:complete